MNRPLMYLHTGISVFVALLATATVAKGDYLAIDSVNGSFALSGGYIDGILESGDHIFTMTDLDILAMTLQNDGIDTEGRLSFLLASTDAGLSFVGLFDGIDGNDPVDSETDHYLGVSATTGVNSDWFASGDTGSQISWNDMGNDTQLVTALLGWDHGQTSAAFAWSDVPEAPSGTMSLYDVDLTTYSPSSIQFISYEKDHWSVAGRASFSVLGQYVFSHQFVPAPGAVALLAIAGLVGKRRRRT